MNEQNKLPGHKDTYGADWEWLEERNGWERLWDPMKHPDSDEASMWFCVDCGLDPDHCECGLGQEDRDEMSRDGLTGQEIEDWSGGRKLDQDGEPR